MPFLFETSIQLPKESETNPLDPIPIPLPAKRKLLEIEKDVSVASQSILQYTSGTCWSWDVGSGQLFWRWPIRESRLAARDGFEIYVSRKLPHYKRKQSKMKDDICYQVTLKIGDVRKKKYITPIPRRVSDVNYFGVPKGIGLDGTILDIRLVYNEMSCGLNDVVWAPNFWLPTADTAIRQLCFGYWSVDQDLGKMFLHFPLPQGLHKYLGVRMESITEHINNMEGHHRVQFFEGWTHCLMGFGRSSFLIIRFYYHGEEFIIGNPRNESNALRWDKVVLNSPASSSFDPHFPSVYKWDNIIRNCVAGAIVTFVDDGRASGKDSEHDWQVSQQAAKRLQYLGIQNAPRKI